MGSFILTCCSTVDMKKEFFEQRQIPYVCFHYTMDGVTYPDDLGQSIPFPEFYDRIAKGATPVTSQVNVEEYCDFFEPFLKEGKDILHLSGGNMADDPDGRYCVSGRTFFPSNRSNGSCQGGRCHAGANFFPGNIAASYADSVFHRAAALYRCVQIL